MIVTPFDRHKFQMKDQSMDTVKTKTVMFQLAYTSLRVHFRRRNYIKLLVIIKFLNVRLSKLLVQLVAGLIGLLVDKRVAALDSRGTQYFTLT